MLHMIKLSVGCSSPEELREWMIREHVNGHGFIRTRSMPKRTEEILESGGSLYRVMNGLILCRQPIIGFEPYTRPDGLSGLFILVSDDIITVQPRPMRAFQGWRYFRPEDAPPDLQNGASDDGIAHLPTRLRQRLAEYGLL